MVHYTQQFLRSSRVILSVLERSRRIHTYLEEGQAFDHANPCWTVSGAHVGILNSTTAFGHKMSPKRFCRSLDVPSRASLQSRRDSIQSGSGTAATECGTCFEMACFFVHTEFKCVVKRLGSCSWFVRCETSREIYPATPACSSTVTFI